MEGRPAIFGEGTKKDIKKISQDFAKEGKRAPSHMIAAKLRKLRPNAHTPSLWTVLQLKKQMRFVVEKVEIHPTLTEA